jgi:crossover junction endodeoxyribonuclease RuvC
MPRLSSRDLWTKKIQGDTVPRFDRDVVPLGRSYQGIVLGVDPSLRGTGLALMEFGSGGAMKLLESKTVVMPSRVSIADCLGAIFEAVDGMLAKTELGHVAMEQTIFVQNVKVAQILGAARGAAMAAASRRGWPVFEYAPLRIKQSVVGHGRAAKSQVARTLMQLLGHKDVLPPDEADAVGAAFCHASTFKVRPK